MYQTTDITKLLATQAPPLGAPPATPQEGFAERLSEASRPPSQPVHPKDEASPRREATRVKESQNKSKNEIEANHDPDNAKVDESAMSEESGDEIARDDVATSAESAEAARQDADESDGKESDIAEPFVVVVNQAPITAEAVAEDGVAESGESDAEADDVLDSAALDAAVFDVEAAAGSIDAHVGGEALAASLAKVDAAGATQVDAEGEAQEGEDGSPEFKLSTNDAKQTSLQQEDQSNARSDSEGEGDDGALPPGGESFASSPQEERLIGEKQSTLGDSLRSSDADNVEIVSPTDPESLSELAPDAGATKSEAHSEARTESNPTLARIATGRAATERPETPPRVDATRFVARVAKAIDTAQARGGEIRLRLSPPELGTLQIKILIDGGAMTATLETETANARNVLLDNLPALRERLAEQDIRIEKFDVDVRDEGREARDWSPDDRQNENRDGDGDLKRRGDASHVSVESTETEALLASTTTDAASDAIDLLI